MLCCKLLRLPKKLSTVVIHILQNLSVLHQPLPLGIQELKHKFRPLLRGLASLLQGHAEQLLEARNRDRNTGYR